jgi:3(or 17)beta-hydroxysteroid dehydrogenase
VTGRLDQQVALVTGGAEGLGKAIAWRLAAEGATVIITDLQRALGTATANEGGFSFLLQDVCDEAQWAHIVTEVETRFGHLNILVNNAGILGPMDAVSPEDTPLSAWRKIFAVNVEGVFLGCREAIPAMRRAGKGAIVNLSSMADRMATPNATAYGASKAAVRQLTMSVAQHCAEQRLPIRCNSVHPGMVRTPLLNQAMKETAQVRGVPFEQIVAEYKAVIPLGDFTRAEDVAAAVAFLASDDARHVTGSALLVDGGLVHCRGSRRSDDQ